MSQRRPTPAETLFLLVFHATLSGAFIVAYLSGDEDTYGMHLVAGYTALAALAVRLLAALFAPSGSPLRLPRPRLRPALAHLSRLVRLDPAARRERSPLHTWMGAALLIGVTAAASSGLAADFVPRLDDLHEASSTLALNLVLAHIALVLALHGLKLLGTSPRASRLGAGAAAILLLAASAAFAGEPARTRLLDGYAAEAVGTSPGFAGFSAERGRALYLGPHQGGRSEVSACAGCHTANPTAQGRHYKTGRAIEPMAVSANPQRFTDAAEVEKRFARDCKNVLGRACTAQEKGDFITFLAGQ